MHATEFAPDRGASAGNFRLYQFCRRLFIEGIRRTIRSGGKRLSHAVSSGGRGCARATRFAAIGLFALGALGASAMLPADNALAQVAEPSVTPTLNDIDVWVTARDIADTDLGHDQTLTQIPGPDTVFSSNVNNYSVLLSETDITTVEGTVREPAISYKFDTPVSADTVLVCRDGVRINAALSSLPVTTITAEGRDLPLIGVPTEIVAYAITAANVVAGTTPSSLANNTINTGSNRPADSSRHRAGDLNVACSDAEAVVDDASKTYVNKYTVTISRGLSIGTQATLNFNQGSTVTATLPEAMNGAGEVTYDLVPTDGVSNFAALTGLSFTASPPTIGGTVSSTATLGTTGYTLTATDGTTTVMTRFNITILPPASVSIDGDDANIDSAAGMTGEFTVQVDNYMPGDAIYTAISLNLTGPERVLAASTLPAGIFNNTADSAGSAAKMFDTTNLAVAINSTVDENGVTADNQPFFASVSQGTFQLVLHRDLFMPGFGTARDIGDEDITITITTRDVDSGGATVDAMPEFTIGSRSGATEISGGGPTGSVGISLPIASSPADANHITFRITTPTATMRLGGSDPNSGEVLRQVHSDEDIAAVGNPNPTTFVVEIANVPESATATAVQFTVTADDGSDTPINFTVGTGFNRAQSDDFYIIDDDVPSGEISTPGNINIVQMGVLGSFNGTIQFSIVARTEDLQDFNVALTLLNAGTPITLSADTLLFDAVDAYTIGVDVPSEVVTVIEGGEDVEYSVSLLSVPEGTVTVIITSDNGDVTVMPTPLTFNAGNWNEGQTVAVSARNDDDGVVDTAMLRHTARSTDDSAYEGLFATVMVTVTEADTPGLMIDPRTLMVPEGGEGIYTVRLNTDPTHAVMVTIGGVSGDVTIDPEGPLTFTAGANGNWDDAQTITVMAAEDDDGVPDEVTLTHTATSTDPAYTIAAARVNEVDVTVVDNDVPGVTISETSLAIVEGSTGVGTNTYTVRLNSEPTADVVIDVTVTGADVTVESGGSGPVAMVALAFTNTDWGVAQTVTVTATEPAVHAAGATATIAHAITTDDTAYTAYGATPGIPDVTVTVTDNDPSSVSVSTNATRISESREEEATITISLNRPVTHSTTIQIPFTIAIVRDDEQPDSVADGNDFTVDYSGADGCVDCVLTTEDPAATTLTGGMLNFATGDQTDTIDISAVMDEDEDEGDQEITFRLGTGTHEGVSFDSMTDMVVITLREIATEEVVVKNEVETVTTLIGAEQVGSISGLIRARFTSPVSVVASAPAVPDTATALHLPDNPQVLGDMLNGLGLEHTASADGGGVYAVWARGTYTSMEGDPTVDGMKVDYDGDSTGLGVGVEKVTGRYVAGVAMNWLTTDLDLRSEDDEGLSKYEESLLMVAPYLALRRDNGRSFWISAGYGAGDADGTTAADGATASADVSVSFLNAGADFVLTTHQNGELIGSLSTLAVRKTVDSFTFEGTDTITATTLSTFRGQGEVTYYRTVEAGDGRIVKPYVGLATLHDAGDKLNDDSHALDLRGGGEFHGEKINASLEISTELLRKDHKSWSISGSARYLFSPEGLGASLTLDGAHATDSNMGMEGGYGMMVREVHKDALLTPFAGLKHGSGGNGEFSSGLRLAIGSEMDADLRAARAFGNDEDTLKLNFRRTF